jgi:hypothetical protein
MQLLFITWYTDPEIRVRVFSLPSIFFHTSSSLAIRSRLFIATASFLLPSRAASGRCRRDRLSYRRHRPAGPLLQSSIGRRLCRRQCTAGSTVFVLPLLRSGPTPPPSIVGFWSPLPIESGPARLDRVLRETGLI